VTPPACVPSCNGRACGGDGCGGTCGSCAAGLACQSDGACGAWSVETVDLPVNYNFEGVGAMLSVQPSGRIDSVVLAYSALYLQDAAYLARTTSGWSRGVELVNNQRMMTSGSFSVAPNWHAARSAT